MSKKSKRKQVKRKAEPPARLLRAPDAVGGSLREDARGIRAEVASGLVPIPKLPRDQRAVIAAADRMHGQHRADAKRRKARKQARSARRRS